MASNRLLGWAQWATSGHTGLFYSEETLSSPSHDTSRVNGVIIILTDSLKLGNVTTIITNFHDQFPNPTVMKGFELLVIMIL